MFFLAVKAIHPATPRTEYERAIGRYHTRKGVVQGLGSAFFSDVIMSENSCFGIEHIQSAAVYGYPNHTRLVLYYARYIVIAKAITPFLMFVGGEDTRAQVQFAESFAF